MNIKDLLDELSQRLPELEWQLGHLDKGLFLQVLPKGLFQYRAYGNSQAYIDEIQRDIQMLSERRDARSAGFLAEHIKQKINILVTMCHLYQKTEAPQEHSRYNVDRLATRQQWLQSLSEKIKRLEAQHQALLCLLPHGDHDGNSFRLLQVQKEIGQIARQLTLAREAFDKATKG